MEFDFKRQPYSVAMTNVENQKGPQKPYQHIAFSTQPWRTFEEYKKVRTFWNDYYKRTRLCIKTVDDFNEFAEFFDMFNSLIPKKRGWLRIFANGDLKRLRRDLCRAFEHAR